MKRKDPAPKPSFGQLAELKQLQPKAEEPPPPTFNELWYKADCAVSELYDTFPEQVWERAAKSERVPIFIPRKRENFKAFMDALKSKGIILTGRGRTRQQDSTFGKEAKAAYEKVQKEKFELRLMKIRGDKLQPVLVEIADLPLFRTKTIYPLWMHWLMEAFMDTHNGEPEKSPKLKKIVKNRVVNQAMLKSLARPTPKAYRNEIKRDFRRAVKRLAKEMTDLMGT